MAIAQSNKKEPRIGRPTTLYPTALFITNGLRNGAGVVFSRNSDMVQVFVLKRGGTVPDQSKPTVVVRIAAATEMSTRSFGHKVYSQLLQRNIECRITEVRPPTGDFAEQAVRTVCGALQLWGENPDTDMTMFVFVPAFEHYFYGKTKNETDISAHMIMVAWAGREIPLHFHFDADASPGFPRAHIRSWERTVEHVQQAIPELPVRICTDAVEQSREIAGNIADALIELMSHMHRLVPAAD